jgi:hypothetical protein
MQRPGHARMPGTTAACPGAQDRAASAIWRAVDTYVMGHAHLSLARDHSEGNTASDPGWRAAAGAYLQGLAGSGSFPKLAAFGAAGLLHNEYDELAFETGLNWLLAGIAADCEAIAPRDSPCRPRFPGVS